MIYTIGYAGLTLPAMLKIIERNNMILIDVRAKPFSRKADFNRKRLEAALGPLYRWHGDTLGGKGQHIAPRGLISIAGIRGRNPLLMCVEEAPEDCHRHHTICAQHFPKAIHIYRDELIVAGELQRHLASNDPEYDICGALEDSTIKLD